MAIKPPKPSPKPGDTFLGERPGLGIKPKPIKPPKPGPAPRKPKNTTVTKAATNNKQNLKSGGGFTPKPGAIYDPVRTVLPGKPGDLKKMPSFPRKTKPVMPRKGGR